jgi:hypothetical protein
MHDWHHVFVGNEKMTAILVFALLKTLFGRKEILPSPQGLSPSND